MFFLGGFNTIIPHLIYLSLIWVFILIGLSGKMNFAGFDRPACSEITFHQESTQQYPIQILPDFHDAEISGNAGNYCIKESIFITLPEPEIFPAETYTVINYRGPPKI